MLNLNTGPWGIVFYDADDDDDDGVAALLSARGIQHFKLFQRNVMGEKNIQ